ncbi:hypothetical protein ILUMI_07298 [Ignelater luminosus]|uniref:Chromo domain-containing protein n=1 Tax=Ignelater luminosus TaxID=2038154 RepID=A0A8K0DDS3_IGNLU|nr:hypothetical protein ILUMI_07298 [Ignelater luminosus]
MRKINMKRKSRKEKADQKKDEENGVEEKSNDPKDSDDENAEPADDEPVPETKKKKTDKRKSGSGTNKKSAKKDAEKEKPTEEEDDTEDSAQYEVQEVLDQKMIRGVRHYLIRWKGYEPESDSWEPESTLQCADLIKKFKASREDQNGKENSSDSPKKRRKSDKKNIKKDKKVKRSSKNKEEADWDSNDEFEVERIIDVYFKRNGTREFLVSWKGYPSSQDSWEPEENLECLDLISKFMNKVEAAKKVDQKELRLNRTPTERFTLNTSDGGRRLSRRFSGKQRVHYHETE